MGIGIREARNSLPSLIKRATQDNEEIQLGSRGADEVTLVASRTYRRMRRDLDRLRNEIASLSARLTEASERADAAAGAAEPYAGLQRALEAGRLDLRPASSARIRRYMPDYQASGETTREERIRIGSHSPEPEFRRSVPRA